MTPTKICCSYRCAVTQHQCSATLLLAKCCTQGSLLLSNTGSQQALCQCTYTCGDLLFIQVCSDPTPGHCSTVQGKMQLPQLSDALQDRFAAGLYHCNHTYKDLLFIQVCSDPTHNAMQHCSGHNAVPLLSAALQDRLAAGFYHCNHTYEDLLFVHKATITIQAATEATPTH